MSLAVVEHPHSAPPFDGTALEWADYFEAEPPKPDLIEGLINASATAIVGPPKVGKSFLLVDASLALLSGDATFLGRAVAPCEHRIAYVSTDLGADMAAPERFHGMASDSDLRTFGDRIRFGLAPLDPSDLRTWRDWRKRHLEQLGTTVMIIDSVTHAAGETAELNSSAGAGPILARVAEVVRDGITVIAVGHTAKAQQGGSGGTTMLGSVRFQSSFRQIVRMDEARKTLYLDTVSNDSAPSRLWFERDEDMRAYLVDEPTKTSKTSGDGNDGEHRQRRKRAPASDIRAVYDQLPPEVQANDTKVGVALFEAGLSKSASGGRVAFRRARVEPGWNAGPNEAPGDGSGGEH